MTSILDERATVLSVEKGRGSAYRALLLSPGIAARAMPMQFVLVRVREGLDPFLRRPFCLSVIDKESGLIGITWDVAGRGTEMMAAWEPGQEIAVLGPLGNGFLPDGAPQRLFLVAGGTGLAPMYPLAAAAKARGWDVTLFYGATSADLLLDSGEFRQLGCGVTVATDDGSEGVRGFVTSVAAPSLKAARPGDTAVACGPMPMLRALKTICSESQVRLYVSLEERMACGTGLCRGCAVRASQGPGEKYLHVCLEGPVFLAEDVVLGGET